MTEADSALIFRSKEPQGRRQAAAPPQPRALSELLPALPDSVPRMRRAVSEFAAQAGAAGAVLEDLRLAVSEAATNVVLHAYVDRDQPGHIRVIAAVDGGMIHVTVSDDGRGMLPRLDSPGLGLGLPLIAQAADTLDVHRSERGGTELRMSFRLLR